MNYGIVSLTVVWLAFLISSTHNQLSLKQQEELIRALQSGRFGALTRNSPGGAFAGQLIADAVQRQGSVGNADPAPAPAPALPTASTATEEPSSATSVRQGRSLQQNGPSQAQPATPSAQQEPLPINPVNGNELNFNTKNAAQQAGPEPQITQSVSETQPAAEIGNSLNEQALSPSADLLRTLEAFAEAQKQQNRPQPSQANSNNQQVEIPQSLFQDPDASLKTLQQLIEQSGGNQQPATPEVPQQQQNVQTFANIQQEQLRRLQQISQSFPEPATPPPPPPTANPLDALRNLQDQNTFSNLQQQLNQFQQKVNNQPQQAQFGKNQQQQQQQQQQQPAINSQFAGGQQVNGQQAQLEQMLRQFQQQGQPNFQDFAQAFFTQQQQQQQQQRQQQQPQEPPPRPEIPAPVVPTPPQTFNPSNGPTGRSLQPPKEEKPFFLAKCKDCNIALGDKEILNFLGDIAEQQQQQQQQNPRPKTLDKLGNSFELLCDNCNVLVGGKEALVAAAQSMFTAKTRQ